MWNVAKGLAHDPAFDVRVLTLTNETTTSRTIDEVDLFPVPGPQPLTYDDSWLVRRRAVFQYYYGLFRALRQQKAKVYYAKLASPEACIVWLVSRLSRAKFVFRIEHDWETNLDDLTNNIFRGRKTSARLFIHCLQRADVVIAQTTAQADAVKRNFGVKTVLIPNGHLLPDESRVKSQPEERTTVLWVGRAHPMKRPGLFIDLAEQFPGRQFVMVMPPESEHKGLFDEIQRRAAPLANVQVIPGVAAAEMDSLYQDARLFVLTSEAEGFSNVVIEAMKNGCPVVTFDHNPNNILNELTDLRDAQPASGYCIRNRMDLANDLVDRLLHDDSFWASCHRGLRATVSQFSIEHVLAAYKRHFGALAEGLQ